MPPWAVVSPAREAHVARVAALLETWADAIGVPSAERARWRRAAVLHDALRDAGPETLARYAPQDGWPVKLWHGPAAAAAAERHGERDAGVLDAVRYHSVGYAGWDAAGRLLYLADFLEPGRTYLARERAAWAARVPAEPDRVLREVARQRLRWTIESGKPIREETWELWNHLVAADSSSRP